MSGRVVVIDGGPAVGKSTLCKSIEQHMKNSGKKCVALLEKVDPFLFSAMMQKNGTFEFQLQMAATKIERIRRAIDLAREGYIVLLDRGIVGDYAFAEMAFSNKLISPQQWDAYNSIIFDCPYKFIHSQRIIEATADVRIARRTEKICSFLRDESCDTDIRVTTLFLKVEPSEAFSRVRFRGNSDEIAAYKLPFFKEIQDRHISLFADHEDVSIIQFSERIPIDPVTGLYDVSDTVAAVARCGI